MVWIVLPKDGGQHPLALVCGGGGAAKSGVKNQIQVMEFVGENGFELVQSLETGDKLCCGLSSATIGDDVIVCVSVDGSCVLYTCNLEKNGKVGFTKRAEFVVDMLDSTGCVNCTVVFQDKNGKLRVLTGGDEGVCRLWGLDKPDGSVATGSSWKHTLLKEFRGHCGPVMAISVHPSLQLFCSGSRDGTFKVWDMSAAEKPIVADVPLSNGTPGNDKAKKLECRGCQFSADGEALFLIMSGRAGAAHLVKWSVKPEEKKDNGRKSSFVISPMEAIMCSKVPATRLKMNAAEGLIGIGSSDGAVTVFNMSTLAKVTTQPAHDMPVTGLAFCPMRLPVDSSASDQKNLILSCSVDYRLASIDLNARSPIFKILFYLLVLLVVLALTALG
ncbi:unnamed protein product, partial [Ectocarpus fasciculatus]